MKMNLFNRIYWRIAEKTWRKALRRVAYSNSLSDGNQLKVRKHFWSSRASWIHYRWGFGEADYQIISEIIANHSITSILDLGCGSGRLFPLYESLSISDVLGVDISKRALAIAGNRCPQFKTICTSFEDMDLPEQLFDLAISVRTLQYVPKNRIGAVVASICEHSKMVFVSEVTGAEGVPEKIGFYWHNYPQLFGSVNYRPVETGNLGIQEWSLWASV